MRVNLHMKADALSRKVRTKKIKDEGARDWSSSSSPPRKWR
jgi:hypothetical protein